MKDATGSAPLDLIELYEVAALANLSTSTVANWRKRLEDFPVPVVDLKSSPIFHSAEVRAWLTRRQGRELTEASSFYDEFAVERGDSIDLTEKANQTVQKRLDLRMDGREIPQWNYGCSGSSPGKQAVMSEPA